MGDHEGWAQPNDVMPNGLLPNEASSVAQVLDQGRWSIAEERTLELIDCIQPNQPSEELRNAVADYVQRLIMKCFSCQVFTFGSVPLKTYLPDGDIDLTAFSKNQNVKDTWANEVRNMLENEEKSENAEFRVKEVQYIQAEDKSHKLHLELCYEIFFKRKGRWLLLMMTTTTFYLCHLEGPILIRQFMLFLFVMLSLPILSISCFLRERVPTPIADKKFSGVGILMHYPSCTRHVLTPYDTPISVMYIPKGAFQV